VKSTGCPGFGIVNVVVTGLTVPRLNAGTVTLALLLLTTVKPWRPTPELTGSTVTEFNPELIDWNAPRLPGNTSVTVSVGVQTPGFGVGVGVAVGVGVGVGVAVGVGVGVGVTVGVGVGVAVGVGVGVGGGGVPSEPFASSSTYAAESLENFRAWAPVTSEFASVSFAVWRKGLLELIGASKGKDAGKPRLCQEAWSEQAYPHAEFVTTSVGKYVFARSRTNWFCGAFVKSVIMAISADGLL
jgi:hypothetical protein